MLILPVFLFLSAGKFVPSAKWKHSYINIVHAVNLTQHFSCNMYNIKYGIDIYPAPVSLAPNAPQCTASSTSASTFG
jgi:hypothetical protein